MSSAAFAGRGPPGASRRRSGCCGNLMRGYERKQRHGLKAFSWLIYRINTPTLRDMLMEEFDLFETRNAPDC